MKRPHSIHKKAMSLLLSFAIVLGMMAGIGILPVFAVSTAGVDIGGTPLTDGKYYTVNTGTDPSSPLVNATDTQPLGSTPYLYYNNDVLKVIGDVNLTSSSGPPVLNINGTLTLAGSGTLKLSSGNTQAVNMPSTATLILSDAVNFTAEQTGSLYTIYGGTLQTAADYSGNIAIHASEHSALSEMEAINLKTSGSIDIFGNGPPPVITSHVVTLEGGTVSLVSASNAMLISSSSVVSITVANGGLSLTGNMNVPLIATGTTTLSANGNISVQNPAGIAIVGNLTVTKAKDVTIAAKNGPTVTGTADITATGDVSLSDIDGSVTPHGLKVTGAKNVSVTASNSTAIYSSVNIGASGDVKIQGTGGDPVIQGTTVSINTSGGSITVLGKGNCPVLNSSIVTLQAFGDVLVQSEASNGAPVINTSNKTITSENGTAIVTNSTGSTITSGGTTTNAAYGGDASGGLNLNNNTPTQCTFYKAGNGYALFTPAAGQTPATLILHNATIHNTTELVKDGISPINEGIAPPQGKMTIQAEGTNTIDSTYGNGIGYLGSDITLTGSGTLNIDGLDAMDVAFSDGSFTLADSANVTLNSVVNIGNSTTVYGNITVKTVNMNHYQLFGNVTIAQGAVLVVPEGETLWLGNTASLTNNGKIINNGSVILPSGYTAAQIQALKLTGTGLVIVSGITVSPSTVSVKKGNSQQFSAEVTENNLSKSVTWSISGNKNKNTTIDQNGKLTVAADETATTIAVKATSTDNTTKFGTAIVNVTGSAENGSADNGGNSTNGNNTNNSKNPQTGIPSSTAFSAAFVSILSLVAVVCIMRKRKRT